MAFNFGPPKTSAGTTGFSIGGQASTGFNFGAPTAKPATTTASAGFSFGAPSAAATTTASTGLSFGAPSGAATTSASSGFNFGAPAATATTSASSGFSFGAPSGAATTSTSTGFNFGAPSGAATTSASTGFSFGAPSTTNPTVPATTKAAPTSGFSVRQSINPPPTTTTAAVSGFSLSAPSSSSSQPQASATSGFSFGSAPSAAAPTGFSVPTVTTMSTSLGAPATTTAKSSFNFSAPSGSAPPKTTAPPAGGLTFTAPTVSAALPASSANATGGFKLTPSNSSATSTSNTAAATGLKQVSYKSLEETIDKWLHDLNEQEKSFLNQAAQVNMWDKQLIDNGEKISEVNSEVERLKAEQGRLDRELDFILSQQDELENLLKPIEEQVNTHAVVTHTQHADIERERTYSLAENIDAQLKHMMQSLNEIIDHINSSNTTPANPADESMAQIAKILNAHMDSLQWIDQNTNKLQQRVKEVSQVMDSQRREQRSFHLGYE